jgi:malate synthase
VTQGIEIVGAFEERFDEILTPEALAFIADLHSNFDPTRRALLEARVDRQGRNDAGQMPDFHTDTEDVRWGDWTVAAPPADLEDRRCEITGPTDAKMLINALNSGARVFMADFEDANSPT